MFMVAFKNSKYVAKIFNFSRVLHPNSAFAFLHAVRARKLFFRGTPSEITICMLKSVCTKFGALDRSVTKKSLTDQTINQDW